MNSRLRERPGDRGCAVSQSIRPLSREVERLAGAGGGRRYLLARTDGMHMGLDAAYGPDGPIVYVVFGSAWLRP